MMSNNAEVEGITKSISDAVRGVMALHKIDTLNIHICFNGMQMSGEWDAFHIDGLVRAATVKPTDE